MIDSCNKSEMTKFRKMNSSIGSFGLWSVRNWSIKVKIPFISFLGVALILAVTVLFFLPYVEKRVMEGEKKATVQTVSVVYGILDHFQQLESSGVYNRKDAKKQAIDLIRQIRYRKNEVFLIIDETPVMVLHPLMPELEGKDLASISDPNGKFIFSEFVKASKSLEGRFVEHSWPEAVVEEGALLKKISYLKEFKPWGWIVVSNIDMKEVERVVAGLRLITMAMAAFFAVVTMLVAYIIGQSITKRLVKVIAGLQEVAQGRGNLDQTQCIAINSSDEIGTLSFEFNALMDSISDLSRFRKVIEEDETCDEVYSRLWDVLVVDIGFPTVVIYEVDEGHDVMKVVYPLNLQEQDIHCSPDIMEKCGMCKAKRTGHPISSLAFNKVCKQFLHLDEAMEHVCIPMAIGGGIIGVVQFVLDDRKERFDRETVAIQIDKASQFIKEALPVVEAKRLTASLRASTLVDPMTGLHNRRFLQECANNLCSGSKRRGKKIGLLMCDLDFFKQVNDTYGHDVGDEVLKKTATILQETVRQSDLVVRFGGEEFIIILVDIEADEVMGLAEKLRKQVESTEFQVKGQSPIKKTISIGISIYPEDEDGFWKTLKYADVALYKAKESGRNKSVRFTKDMWDDQQY
ncbi:MAG: diguanylate cyclase [Magnetococcales bacterium]|nr:diguanylate cyclase [Magnetococcales bacterium]